MTKCLRNIARIIVALANGQRLLHLIAAIQVAEKVGNRVMRLAVRVAESGWIQPWVIGVQIRSVRPSADGGDPSVDLVGFHKGSVAGIV